MKRIACVIDNGIAEGEEPIKINIVHAIVPWSRSPPRYFVKICTLQEFSLLKAIPLERSRSDRSTRVGIVIVGGLRVGITIIIGPYVARQNATITVAR